MTCSGCGFEAPADFAFCPKCGARLAAAPAPPPPPPAPPTVPEGDRRPVTVLFADLAGFTALSEGLDPEDVRAIQSDLFREMSASIDRYEGFVEKFVGDAVMAVFGAPRAHEDDPERGLRAALLMRERMDVLNQRWERRVGRPLALHIGVNTGPVVAGRIGASADAAYAVTGDTVNTASRLQSAAPAGEIFISATTYQLTQHAFAFAPSEEIRVKGKSEPVAVHRLLGPLAAPRSARGLEGLGLAAPLVGRERELQRMDAAFEETRAGRAQVLSLIGEPGAGKTRLQREFFARLEADGRFEGITIRRAACSALGEQTYGTAAALLRDAYGVEHGASVEVARSKLAAGLETLGVGAEDRAAMVAALARVLGLERDDTRVRHLEPEQLKRQIFMASRALVERRLATGPLVLVVEDLHWADAASIELLGAVADGLADRPLLLLLMYRPTLEPDSLGTSRAPHTAIELMPLSRAGSEDLLVAWFGDATRHFPEHLRNLILERAGGNPLYLEEVVRALVAAGVLVRDGLTWRCAAEAADAQVPSTLHGLLLARLDRLDPAERRVIQEAAVIGPRFEASLLRAASAEPAGLDAALDALVRADLITPGPDHRFRHGLLQEIVYQNILVARRTELHTRVGTVLEAESGGAPESLERLETLGHHWSLGADKRRGARYLMAAGDWARGVYANADAIGHYRRVLDALEHCEDVEAERLVARERMADLLGPTGRRAAALGEYELVEAGYRAAADAPAQARILRKMGGLHWDAGARARALQCFETGLALLGADREHIEGAHLYQEMGRLAFRSGESQRAVEWAEQARLHAERLAADPSLGAAGRVEAATAAAQSHNTLGVALARLGRLEEAVGHIERSVALARENELLQAACRGFANLSVLYSTLDPARAIETCAAGLEMAKKIGDLGFQSRLYANLAVAYCALTNRCDEQGVGAAHAAIDLDRRLGQLDHLAVPLIVLGQIYQCHGDPTRAIAHYQEALALAEEADEPQLLFPCYDGLATVHLDLGDEARAEEFLLKAQAVCERVGLEPDALVVLPFLD
ncbi:MAG TPA: adenylate/guanylate cyclase domain-containing protein [Methylomirabilota bacterium]|nr:adenylate/guanylate cyclase domain-containing protein [Methylomirabilota bacterium]